MLLEIRRIINLFVLSAVFTAILPALGAGMAQAQSQATGGFVDSATGAGMRPRLSAGEIQAFMPQRGTFTFPAPYGTTGVRLTNAGDCGGGDCVNYVGYSYWRNINNHVGSDTMLIVLGLDRQRGGGGPTLFGYNKNNGQTQNLGPLFSADSPYSWASGEGWYFSASQRNALYMNDGFSLMRYDVVTHAMTKVFDVRDHLGADRRIWQIHSSNDDNVHSATVKDGSYNDVGCVAYNQSTGRATYIARKGDFDECQIDKSGRWLLVKENIDGKNGEDNRIIDLQSGAEQVFYDEEGAAGHSDMGYGYLVAEDNMYNAPGAVRVWQFGQPMNAPGQGTLVYETASWDGGGVGHLSHGNAKAGTPLNQQMVCSSNAYRTNLPRVNEIVCYRLDGSMNTLIVAPNMTDLNAPGGGSDDYSKRPKGNLDPTGEYFIWTSNIGTNRADAFIVRVPQQKLGVSGGAPAPAARTGSRASPGAHAGSRSGADSGSGTRSDAGAGSVDRQRAVDELDQRHRFGKHRPEDRRLRRLRRRECGLPGRDQRNGHAGVRGVRLELAAVCRAGLWRHRYRRSGYQLRHPSAVRRRRSPRGRGLQDRDELRRRRPLPDYGERRRRHLREERRRVLHERRPGRLRRARPRGVL